MSCDDQPRSGRLSTCQNVENLEKFRNPINADSRRISDEISVINGFSWSSCQRMLTEDLYMKRVSYTCQITVCYTVHCSVKKVKLPRYRTGVPQRVGRGIALLFHDRSTRKG